MYRSALKRLIIVVTVVAGVSMLLLGYFLINYERGLNSEIGITSSTGADPGGNNIHGLPPGIIPAISQASISPLPELNQLSELEVSLSPLFEYPNGQIVVELPSLWSINSTTPDYDQIVDGPSSVFIPGSANQSKYLVWNRPLPATGIFQVTIRAVPTDGDDDVRHHEILVFLHDGVPGLAVGRVATFYARVGNTGRPGSFQRDYPDYDVDLREASEGILAQSAPGASITYVDGTTVPLMNAPDIQATPHPEDDPAALDGYIQVEQSPVAESVSTAQIHLYHERGHSVSIEGSITLPDGWTPVGSNTFASTIESGITHIYTFSFVPHVIRCNWHITANINMSALENSLGYPDFEIQVNGGEFPCIAPTGTAIAYPATATPGPSEPTPNPTSTYFIVPTSTNPSPSPTAVAFRIPRRTISLLPPGAGINQNPCPQCVPDASVFCPLPKSSGRMRVKGQIIVNNVTGAGLRVEFFGSPRVIDSTSTNPITMAGTKTSERLGVTVTDSSGRYNVCVPQANYVRLRIVGTDSGECGDPGEWQDYTTRVQMGLPLGEAIENSDPTYDYWTKWYPAAIKFYRCPYHIDLGVVDLGNKSGSPSAMFIATVYTDNVRQAMLDPNIAAIETKGNPLYKTLVGYPNRTCPNSSCVITNNRIRVHPDHPLLGDILVHEYGHIVHGAKSGHHIYVPGMQETRAAFLEGLAEFFMWSVELEKGIKGQNRGRPRMETAEATRAGGPKNGYNFMGSFFWDMADYRGANEDQMECPIDPEIDTSVAKHSGIFDSLENSPDSAPAWVAHWVQLHNLHNTPEFDVVRAIANHHEIIVQCSPPGQEPTEPAPEPAPPPCPSGPPAIVEVCVFCRNKETRSICLLNCLAEKFAGDCSKSCYFYTLYSGKPITGCP